MIIITPNNNLKDAIINNNLPQVKKLLSTLNPFKRAGLEAHIDNTMHPLMVAAEYNRVEIIEYLIEKGAKIDIKSAALGHSALMYATAKNCFEAVVCLLKHGANVNTTSSGRYTPFIDAAQFGYIKILEELTKFGADINAKTNEGYTALHLAAKYNQQETTLFCLKQGLDVNIKSPKNETPLHLAVEQVSLKTIKCLLSHGAKVDVYDNSWNTPLMQALNNIEEGGNSYIRTEIAHHLLTYGANINLPNQKGETPRLWANRNPNQEISKIILGKDEDNIVQIVDTLIQNKKSITLEELTLIKELKIELLTSLLTTGHLLKTLKEQPYQQQLNAYPIIKGILPPQKRKEFEESIRNNRQKEKA